MKLRYIAVLAMALFAAQIFAQETSPKLTSEKDKLSYSIGQSIGSQLRQQAKRIDLDILLKGLADSFLGNPALLSEQEIKKTMSAFRQEMMAKQVEVRKKLAAEREKQAKENLKKGKTFLAENAKKDGIVTLKSGLQYQILTPGTGKTPTATDEVTTNYRGTLIDGTEFDSSYKRGEPTTFRVNQVVAGWQEALQLMQEGAKWQLFIPANLGYGQRGAPGSKIGPNATLIFELELVSVKEAAKPAPVTKEEPSKETPKESLQQPVK